MAWLSQRFPWVGVAIGGVLLAAALALIGLFDRKYFHSDGSAAGLVLFFFYAIVVGALAATGITCLGLALGRMAREEGEPSYAKPAIVVAALVAIVFIGFKATPYVSAVASQPAVKDSRPQGPTLVKRTVAVEAEYRVAWKATADASKLELQVGAADLPLPPRERVPAIGESVDGPLVLDVVVPSAEASLVSLRLNRHDGFAEEEVADALDGKSKAPGPRDAAMPKAFWVETRGGDWKLLGWACDGAAPAGTVACHSSPPLARWMPMLFGVSRVALHVATDRANARCDFSFRYEGRIATLSTRERCGSAASVAAFASGIDTLARFSRDARNPPDAAERKRREDEGLRKCESSAGAIPQANVTPEEYRATRDRVESVCDHALRLAAARLKAQPAEASAAMVRALMAKHVANSSIRMELAQDIVDALAAAGQERSADALRAHALRLRYMTLLGKPDAALSSFDAFAASAVEVLPADDRAFDVVDSVASVSTFQGDKARYLAMVEARRSRAPAGTR